MNLPIAANKRLAILLTFLLFCFSTAIFPSFVKAQTGNLDDMKKQAVQLLNQNNYIDALPLLEKLAAAEPDNPTSQFYLGYCLIAKSLATKDETERRALRVRARGLFVKAQQLGKNDELTASLIESISPDGSEKAKFSDNKEAEALMEQGEAAFSQGKNDDALSFYTKALAADPKLYYAAVFAGDVYMQKGDFTNAETWYQKAIAIDPNSETAYRYSATPLMKQGKYDEARNRYVDAFITEPYNRLAVGAFSDWADITKKTLSHPKINIPANVSKGSDGNTVIAINPGSGDAGDTSFVWFAYSGNKALWQTGKDGKLSEKFHKAYPDETVYRHSLAEEADSLKTAITILKENMNGKDSKVKTLDPSLATLVELNDKGLIEPYILLAKPDAGIARDYKPYLQANRAKLRQYVLEYVIH